MAVTAVAMSAGVRRAVAARVAVWTAAVTVVARASGALAGVWVAVRAVVREAAKGEGVQVEVETGEAGSVVVGTAVGAAAVATALEARLVDSGVRIA